MKISFENFSFLRPSNIHSLKVFLKSFLLADKRGKEAKSNEKFYM